MVSNLQQVVKALKQGQVVAYPTEGVFGLGCDPDNEVAIERLLTIKQRPSDKGLILIAADFQQLQPYLDLTSLSAEQLQRVFATWPVPYTWVMPASARASALVTGYRQTVAVRVSDHPLVQKLCSEYGKPLTSTSANLSGQTECKTVEQVQDQLGSQISVILFGEIGERHRPSEIRDARTEQLLRQG